MKSKISIWVCRRAIETAVGLPLTTSWLYYLFFAWTCTPCVAGSLMTVKVGLGSPSSFMRRAVVLEYSCLCVEDSPESRAIRQE